MKVDFISFSKQPKAYIEDPSFRYRCQNLQLSLIRHGYESSLHHIDSFSPTPETTHVVFHRPKYSYRLSRLIKKLRRANIIAIADFDDLVFDPNYIDFSPALLNKVLTKRKVSKTYRLHFEALMHFENVSVSTNYLEGHVRRILPNANINVLHNALHIDWGFTPKYSQPRQKTITYFPGTRSHDRDFLQVEDALATFLSTTSSVRLLVIGPLSSKLLTNKSISVDHSPKLPFNDYSKAVSNSWVNLLPLEPTPFNQCKSAIKVIEAASYSAPTICSPLPDALRFENIGATVAIDQQQWITKLEKLLDEDFYKDTINQINTNFTNSTNPEIMVEQFCEGYTSNQK